jgi:hypothetical protein
MNNIHKLYESGRFPHALLLLNGQAEEVLELYNCNPADVVFVKESMPLNDKKLQPYQIKALREIIASGNLRPQFGDTRLFVFREFDTMTELCQNALLKFIEEPHEFNKFVLTANSKSTILPTIISRVVTIGSDSSTVAETNEIAASIVASLIRKDEYTAAAAFSRVKDRLVLTEVLQALQQELLNVNQLSATDIAGKYIRRMEVNPNIPMTVTSCVAELQKEISN